MAKNKKKKAQMFRNFLAFKAGQGNNPNPQAVVVNQSNQPSSFQTPHSDQEKLMELIDDNVGGGPNQPNEMNKPSSSGTNTNPGQKINKWTALKPVEDSSNIQVIVRQDKSHPNVTIVEGSASKIQLVIDKSKKGAQSNNSPKPVEEPRTGTPPVATPAQATPQATNSQTPAQIYTIPSKKAPRYQHVHVALPRHPAGIPRSMLKSLTEAKDIPPPAVGPMPASATIVREEKSPSPQANPQAEKQMKSRPTWVPASHNTPGWPSQQAPNQPNTSIYTGSGWPIPRSTPVPTINPPTVTNYDNYWPVAGQQVNDLSVQVDINAGPPQAYSPSDVYSEGVPNDEMHARKRLTEAAIGATDEEIESPEILQAGSKRLSAFQRLGPLAEQPKKPKLTINLLCQKDVRNVVDETDDIPTHLRDYITSSVDETVLKYLDVWPFKKNIVPARTATLRQSKSVMMLETEYMEEAYNRDNRFILVGVTGYPPFWSKEDVLDAVLESVKGKSFIPCFIEFSRVQCKFLVIRCRLALLAIHKYGFVIRKEGVELIISLSNVHLNLNQLDFVPRLVLRKLLMNKLDEDSLDLSDFTTKSDISHFVYFPLSRMSNQAELILLQSTVPWEFLTKLNLSHNRLTTLTGLNLLQTTPKLRHLDLSYNCIEKATMLLQCRNMPLKTLHLEGNPLCNDYIEQEHYIKVLTMIFTGLQEIDGVPIKKLHDLPDAKRNYCPEEAKHIIDKVLEVLFPLLDASQEQRYLMEDLYHADAVLTITFMYRLRYSAVYKDYRNLFNRARVMDEGDMESIVGSTAIAKVTRRWPDMIHDPATFNVDVLYHSDSTTIVRIGGIVKITAESLADEEHLLSFTRTLVLHTRDGSEYKITNEMLYWDLPEREYAETAFKITRVKPKNLSLRLDAPPDDELKEKLLNVFMQITELEKRPSERCLEEKDWNIRNALEYFSKLLKLDNLDPIMKNP